MASPEQRPISIDIKSPITFPGRIYDLRYNNLQNEPVEETGYMPYAFISDEQLVSPSVALDLPEGVGGKLYLRSLRRGTLPLDRIEYRARDDEAMKGLDFKTQVVEYANVEALPGNFVSVGLPSIKKVGRVDFNAEKIVENAQKREHAGRDPELAYALELDRVVTAALTNIIAKSVSDIYRTDRKAVVRGNIAGAAIFGTPILVVGGAIITDSVERGYDAGSLLWSGVLLCLTSIVAAKVQNAAADTMERTQNQRYFAREALNAINRYPMITTESLLNPKNR